ncbi:hypothetical protein ACUN29_41805 (plasmid) [Streptomyces sp. WC2508]|uniref:hypothetical protein n=1 Tax=Streptomyces sp. WC2508 TaxID=3461405 RepID=UPI0040451179
MKARPPRRCSRVGRAFMSCWRPSYEWITNPLALLTLPVEIQVMLSAGEVSERDGRSLARHLKEDPSQDSAQLLAHLTSAKEVMEQQKAEEQHLLAAGREALARAGSSDLLSADNIPSTGDRPSAGATTKVPPTKTDSPALLSADNNSSRSAAEGANGKALHDSSTGLSAPTVRRG